MKMRTNARRPTNRELLRNQSGQGLTEYLILLILVGVVCIAGVKTLGKSIDERLTEARKKIDGVSVNLDR